MAVLDKEDLVWQLDYYAETISDAMDALDKAFRDNEELLRPYKRRFDRALHTIYSGCEVLNLAISEFEEGL